MLKPQKKNISEILQIRLKAANLKRPTKPEEVSKLVLKLISDKNSNGKVFNIDGGIVKKQ